MESASVSPPSITAAAAEVADRTKNWADERRCQHRDGKATMPVADSWGTMGGQAGPCWATLDRAGPLSYRWGTKSPGRARAKQAWGGDLTGRARKSTGWPPK